MYWRDWRERERERKKKKKKKIYLYEFASNLLRKSDDLHCLHELIVHGSIVVPERATEYAAISERKKKKRRGKSNTSICQTRKKQFLSQ